MKLSSYEAQDSNDTGNKIDAVELAEPTDVPHKNQDSADAAIKTDAATNSAKTKADPKTPAAPSDPATRTTDKGTGTRWIWRRPPAGGDRQADVQFDDDVVIVLFFTELQFPECLRIT